MVLAEQKALVIAILLAFASISGFGVVASSCYFFFSPASRRFALYSQFWKSPLPNRRIMNARHISKQAEIIV